MKSLRYRVLIALFGVATLFVWGGCSTEDESSTTELPRSGVALTIGFLDESDVAQMRFAVMECGNSETFDEAVIPLADMYLPSLPAYGLNPFDEDSMHLFADAFFWLPAGCYDVVVLPLTAAGEPSLSCGGADRQEIEVADGAVTEITLVMQCVGPDAGGLDVAGTLNHPPQIEAVTYSPSKFVCVCELATICAAATDPDGDPIEFDWGTLDPLPAVVNGAVTEQCATTYVSEVGTQTYAITAYDLAGDGERVEALVAPETSHDTILIPLHIAAMEDFLAHEGVRQPNIVENFP